MVPVLRPCRPIIRFVSLTLLSGALLLASVPVDVARAETCDFTGKPGTSQIDARKGRLLLTVLHDASGALDGANAAQLTLTFDEDGNARAHGVLHLPDADPPAVLVATGEAQMDCDTLGTGITSLGVRVFQPSGGGVQRVDISDLSSPITATGVYDVTLSLRREGTIIETLSTRVEVVFHPSDPVVRAAKHKHGDDRPGKGGKSGKDEHGKRRR
jgi:hypothetical protein